MASIDTLSIELTASTAKASAELDKLTGKLNTLNKSLAKTGLSSGLAGIGQAFLGMSSALPRLTMGLGKFASVGRSTTKATKGMSSSIASLYANIWSLSRIAGKAFTGIKGSMDLIETYHYFDVAMSKIGEQSKDAWREHGKSSAEEYADSFRERSIELNQKMSGFTFDQYGIPKNTGTKSLGMDPDLVMQYQAQYAQMADSIGMTGEAALATSEAMTMLAGDWSSLRNLEFNDSFQKMASALAGQSRAVRSLGIDITQAALQQTAYNIGLKTSVTNMDQATKAELRMITILDQSRVAWGDLANTINTPANQLRMIKQNFISLARTIGNIFLPIVGKALPYINGLVIALQRLAEWLAGFLGVDLKNTVGSMGGLDNDILGDLADDAGETAENLDDADKKAKELKKTILGFDELHVLNDNKEDEDEGKGTTGINGLGAGEQALLDAALNDLLDEYKKVWDKAFADMNSKAEEFAKKLQEIATKIRDFVKNGEFEKLGEYLASGINFVLDKAAEAINADKVLGKLHPVIDAITTTFNSMVDNIDFDKIGSILANGINIISGVIRRFADGIDEFNLGQKLADAFNALLRDVDWSGIGNTLASLLNSLWDLVRGFVKKLDATKLGDALGNLFDGLNDNIKWAEIGDTIELAFNKFWTALRNFFLDRDRFCRLGENFATLLNHAISIRNFSLAGETIALAFNDLFATLKGFIDRFDWDKLAAAMKAGFKAFVKNINITEAAEILNETVLSLLGTIRKAIDKNDWHALGEDIGNAFKAIDWARYLKMGIDIIKDTLGELFIGAVKGAFGDFGENFARGFVEGISDVLKLDVDLITSVGDALGKFAETLNKFSPTLVKDLGKALGVLFGIKITGNIASAIANLVTQLTGLKSVLSGGILGKTVSKAGGSSGGGLLGGLLGGGLASKAKSLGGKVLTSTAGKVLGSIAIGSHIGNALATDIMDNGATMSSDSQEFGLAEVEDYVRRLGDVINDTSSALHGFNINFEKLDTSSVTSAIGSVAKALVDAGVSSNEYKQVVGDNMSAVETSVLGAMMSIEQGVTDGAQKSETSWYQFSKTFNVVGTSVQGDADKMRGMIHDALVGIDTSLTGNTRLWELLDETVGQSTGNSQQKFQEFCGVLSRELGWSDEQINAFITKMKENFPAGVTDGSNKAVQSLQNFSVGASTEYKKVDGSVSEVIKKILGIGPAAEDADSRSKGLQTKLKGWTSPISGLLKGLSLWATGEGVEGVGDKSEKAQPKVENFDTAVQSIDKNGTGKQAAKDVGTAIEGIGTASTNAATTVNKEIGGLATKIEEHAPNIKSASETDGKAVINGLSGSINDNLHLIDSAVGTMWGIVSGGGQRYMEIASPSRVMYRQGENVISGLYNGISDNAYGLDRLMQDIANRIRSPFDGVTRDIVSTFNNLGYNISRAAGNLYDVGRGMGSSLAAGFSSFRITLPHFGWDWSRITYGNGGWFDIPNIWVRWYAKGGVFTDPTIAGFGESGTEAALPLTNKHTMAMVSDAIVNSGGALSNGMSREDVIEAVATGVAMAMGQNPQTVEVVVNSVLKTSDEKLAQSVSRGQARLNQRYNVAY